MLILGSGMAGLCAALAAQASGLHPLILEKDELIGGGTTWSMGILWVGANALGTPDSEAAVRDYMEYIAGGAASPARRDALITASPRALQFFRGLGLPLQVVSALCDHHYGRAPGAVAEGRTLELAPFEGHKLGPWRKLLNTSGETPWRLTNSTLLAFRAGRSPLSAQEAVVEAQQEDRLCLGVGLIAHLLALYVKKGGLIETRCRASRLLRRAGRVSGVATGDGRRFHAKRGVIIATGGYESDESLVTEFDQFPEHKSQFPASLTGDGLRMAGDIGSAIHRIPNNLLVMLGYDDPQRTGNARCRPASNEEMSQPHTITVNRAGCRFGDESSFQRMAPALRAYDAGTRAYCNLPCWLVFDQQYVDAHGFAGRPRGTAPEWVVRAHSLSALAEQIGVDPRGLLETTVAFNRYAAAGVDAQFGRGTSRWAAARPSGDGPNPSLGSLERAPFYAVRLHPVVMGSAGLKCDASAKVLDWSNSPIQGLYAAGNVAAHDEYGVGYQAGHSLTSAMTFALLAVEDLLNTGPSPHGD